MLTLFVFWILQTKTNNKFGPELRDICELFRRGSIWAIEDSGLHTLVEMLAVDVSVQVVAPWNSLPALDSIVTAEPFSLSDIQERLTPEKRLLLLSFVGQPEIAKMLTYAVGCIGGASQLLLDCTVALSFIRYLSDAVKLTVPLDMRHRIWDRAIANPFPSPEPYPCPYQESDDHSESNCAHCGYDHENFRVKAQHYPGWPVSREGGRGKYKKDGKRQDEKAEEKQSCDKDFSKGKRRGAGGENCLCCAWFPGFKLVLLSFQVFACWW
jgi:hypothetical protein